MSQDFLSRSSSRRQSGTASPSAAQFRGRGPRTATGALASAVVALAAVTAVLAPLALVVVGVVTLTGGAFLGVATDVGRDAAATSGSGGR